MSWIRIEDEVERLGAAWRAEEAAMGKALRGASASLLAKIDLGRGRAEAWTRLFAPWTSLYPLLQAEGLPGADLHQATRLTLAHLAILIHAFADDRQRDGQLELTEAEAAFSRHCFDLAMMMLNDELPDIFPDHPEVRRMLDEYTAAQAARWPGAGADVEMKGSGKDAGVRRIARGRAIHGYLAPLSVILSSGATAETEARMREAYEQLVTGLQWGDDVEDWEADWRAGRQNLLLTRLAACGVEGVELAQAGAGAGRDAGRSAGQPAADLRSELVRRGIVDEALDRANQCFEAAAGIQEGLGCAMLAGILRLLPMKVERLRREFAGAGSGAGAAWGNTG